MSDDQTTPTNSAKGTEQGADNPADQITTVEQLPQWAREAITSANNEAARHRHAKKDAVETARSEVKAEYETKLAEAAEKVTDLQDTVSARELELVKLRTAIDAGVPNEAISKFASLLQGTDEDEVKSHAEEVKELFKIKPPADKPVDYSQGQGRGTPPPLNGDPILNALKAAVRAH